MEHAAPLRAQTPTAPATGLATTKLGMWLFLASEVMFFTGLIGTYIVVRIGSPTWPIPGHILDIPITAVNTFILICSSVTMALSLAAAQRGSQRALRGFLVSTIALGMVFVGIQAFEWTQLIHEGLRLNAGPFDAYFFTLTGFHGAHVCGGVITLIAMLIRSLLGHFTPSSHDALEAAALYWHFVDLVWIILFTILYLI